MRNFSQKKVETIWFDLDLFHLAFEKTSLKIDFTYTSKILVLAAELIFYRNDEGHFLSSVLRYTKRFREDNNYNLGP